MLRRFRKARLLLRVSNAQGSQIEEAIEVVRTELNDEGFDLDDLSLIVEKLALHQVMASELVEYYKNALTEESKIRREEREALDSKLIRIQGILDEPIPDDE